VTTPRGRFIVLEGIDGAGTTTQLERLARTLEARGVTVHRTCEPSTGPVGGLIRQYLRHTIRDEAGTPRAVSWDTMALLFAADRVDHVCSEVEPMLAQGTWVLSDRYDLSSLAYQSATAPSDEVVGWIRELNARALRPDLTLVVDVPAELAAQRRGARGGSEELYEKQELQQRLADVYASAERLVPGDRLVHVPGAGSPDEVAARVLAAVDAALGTPGPG
jgi:dTMP kinase